MQLGADAVGQTDSVDRSYGGGCATRRGIRRGMKPNQGRASCAQIGKPITSIAAIVASLEVMVVRGAFGVDAPARPAAVSCHGRNSRLAYAAIGPWTELKWSTAPYCYFSMAKHRPNRSTSSTHFSKEDLIAGEWISPAAAARLRGVTRQAILRLIKKNRFRVLEIADKIFLNRREVKAYKIKPSGRPRKTKKRT